MRCNHEAANGLQHAQSGRGLSLAAARSMRIDVIDIAIALDGLELAGTLAIPTQAAGLVIFAHGSGSSQHSPRNRHVAAMLNERGLATLLFDLLTAEEERIDAVDATLRFDVDMLAERLVAATDSLIATGRTRGLPLGYFGGSTGAAAALIAAARRPDRISAVVSRGGRPDLASDWLARVHAPTLLIVGGADTWVLQANERSAAKLEAPHELAVIAGATHLFEEPGALDEVARIAAIWFKNWFGGHAAREAG
jgi:pimeloyl-ACP methyl ester carboxylesterase